MKYYIDYKHTTGKILGYLTDATVKQKQGQVIEVDFFKYNEAMAFNKIIIDGDNITFEKVDWRTLKEIEELRIISIDNRVESIITKPYPIYKQLNIRGLLNPYTIQDIEVMDMFIDSVRGIGKEAKSTGKTVDEINWGGLDEYTNHDEILKDAIIQIREKLGL